MDNTVDDSAISIDAAVDQHIFRESVVRRGGSGQFGEVCKYWLQGKCRKDDKCEFMHVYDLPLMPECRHGVHCGTEDCPFKHTTEDGREPSIRGVCLRYLEGFCPDGPACRLMHVTMRPEERPLVSLRLAYNTAQTSEMMLSPLRVASIAAHSRRGPSRTAGDDMLRAVEWQWHPNHPANRPRLLWARRLRMRPNDGKSASDLEWPCASSVEESGVESAGQKRGREEIGVDEGEMVAKKGRVEGLGDEEGVVGEEEEEEGEETVGESGKASTLVELLRRYRAAAADPGKAGFSLPDSATALRAVSAKELKAVGATRQAVSKVAARYFVVKSPSSLLLRVCARRNAWGVTPDIARYLNAVLKTCSAVFVFFSVVGSRSFQGVARLVYGSHDLRREPCLIRLRWLRLCSLPMSLTRNLANPMSGLEKVARSWDWQELPPALGRAMMLLTFESPRVSVALEVPSGTSRGGDMALAAATDLEAAPGTEHRDSGWVGGGGVLGSAKGFVSATPTELLRESFGRGIGPDEVAVPGISWGGFSAQILRATDEAAAERPIAAVEAEAAGLGAVTAAAAAAGKELSPEMIAVGMLQHMMENGLLWLGKTYGTPFRQVERFSGQYRSIHPAAPAISAWATQSVLVLPIRSSEIETSTKKGIAPIPKSLRPPTGIQKDTPILLLDQTKHDVIGLFVTASHDIPPPATVPITSTPTVVGLICVAVCPRISTEIILQATGVQVAPGIMTPADAKKVAAVLFRESKAPLHVLGAVSTLVRGFRSLPNEMGLQEQQRLHQQAMEEQWHPILEQRPVRS